MATAVYTVAKTTNRWDRHGRPVDHTDEILTTTADAFEAGRALSAQDRSKWGAELHEAIEVRDAAGNRVQHVDLYAAVVGAEVFAAQEADPDFSINLDDFFMGERP